MIKAFYLHPIEVGQKIYLDGDEGHHIFRVLRAKIGEKIIILNGNGHFAIGHIVDLNRKEIEIDSVEYRKSNEISIYAAILKSKAMDLLIRDISAIGVRKIIPIYCDCCEVKNSSIEKKLMHWRSIAKESCKQSGNPNLPIIEEPQHLAEILFNDINSKIFVAAIRENSGNIFTYKNEILSNNVSIFIGPEGDFSDKEYSIFAENNAYFVKLSDNILRSETAALYFLAMIEQLKKA